MTRCSERKRWPGGKFWRTKFQACTWIFKGANRANYIYSSNPLIDVCVYRSVYK